MKKLHLLSRLLLLVALVAGSTCVWAQETWVATELANLTADDVFVIVGTNSSTSYAMSNENGTSNAPSAVKVTVSDDKLTGEIADNIKWTISGNVTDGYTFYPNGSTDTWLYCTATNNGVRVGTNTNKTFEIKDDYLYHKSTSRYIGIYNGSDWRCYTSINANIKDETFAFYKKVNESPSTEPIIDAENIEITHNATNGSIAYTITNEVEGGKLTATCTSGSDWLTIGNISDDAVAFTNTTNTGDVRTATVELKYTYTDGTEQSVTKEVTITQGTALQEIWVATELEDLTADDVFVIVGTTTTNSYAMSNDNGTSSAPTAVTVTVSEDKLLGNVADNIKWTVNSATEGYTFYPNGSTDTWLYCTNTNNGVRVGTGDAKHFTLTENGYLTTTETEAQRYIGVYEQNPDWRCYNNINTNIQNQIFAFYKKMKVTSVAISSAEYATFVADYAIDLSETGIKAYTAQDKETYVSLTEIEGGKVPANTPVVLYKEDADGSVINVPVITDVNLAVGDNDLKVSTGTDVDNMYVLANKESGVGFYKWAGTTPLSEGKVYLQGKTAGARDFLGFDNETTGINTTLMNNEAKNKEFYNLAGQRVAQPTKGLYIVNGNKVIIK